MEARKGRIYLEQLSSETKKNFAFEKLAFCWVRRLNFYSTRDNSGAPFTYISNCFVLTCSLFILTLKYNFHWILNFYLQLLLLVCLFICLLVFQPFLCLRKCLFNSQLDSLFFWPSKLICLSMRVQWLNLWSSVSPILYKLYSTQLLQKRKKYSGKEN